MAIGSGAGTIVSGQRKLVDIATARKKPQFTGETINISGDVAPLYLLIKKLGKSKKVNQASYFHLETDWLPVEVTNTTVGTGTTVTITAGHEVRVAVGTILLCTRTGELMRVNSVASGSLGVDRGVGGGGPGAVALQNPEPLLIVGFADTEGNTSPSGKSSEPTSKTNYCQTFRQALELSGRDLESDNYGPGELERIKGDALEAITQNMEKSFLLNNCTGTATDPSMTAGVLGLVTTNAYDVAGALTETALTDNFITPWFRRNNSKKRMMVFAGEKFLRALGQFGLDNIRYASSDTGIGISVMKYRTNFGEVECVRHGLLTPVGNSNSAATYGMQGYAFGLNMEYVGKRVFGDRELQLLKDRQTPDRDGIKWEYLSDEGFYLASESQHAILKGITG